LETWNKFFKESSTGVPNSIKNNPTAQGSFECDLYFKIPEEHPSSLENVLKDVVDEIITTSTSRGRSPLPPDLLVNGKWLLMEICEDPTLIQHKLYQLERALHFLPRDPELSVKLNDIGAVVLLMNSTRNEFDVHTTPRMLIPTGTRIGDLSIPLYYAWTPHRNQFTAMLNLENHVREAMGNLQVEMENIDVKMENLEVKVTNLEVKVAKTMENLGKKLNMISIFLVVGGVAAFGVLKTSIDGLSVK